jgi:hypothetical protein
MNGMGRSDNRAFDFNVTDEAVAQLKKIDPIVESTKNFCFLTNIQRDF